MNKHTIIGIGLLFCQLCIAQTDQVTRIDIQKRKIKAIKSSTYTCFFHNRENLFSDCNLFSILQEQYDTLGNLVTRNNETVDSHYIGWDNFKYEYQYDNYGNVILEHLQRKFLTIDTKWAYKYDVIGKMTEKSLLDSSGKANYTSFYFYNKYGYLIKDSSLAQLVTTSSNTTYFYRNNKLEKKITLVLRGNYKDMDETIYKYNDKGLLKEEVRHCRQTLNKKCKNKTIKLYYYNNDNRLIKTKQGDSISEFLYDSSGQIIKKLHYIDLLKLKGRPCPSYESIEYEYF